jgi:hypothetical protein
VALGFVSKIDVDCDGICIKSTGIFNSSNKNLVRMSRKGSACCEVKDPSFIDEFFSEALKQPWEAYDGIDRSSGHSGNDGGIL